MVDWAGRASADVPWSRPTVRDDNQQRARSSRSVSERISLELYVCIASYQRPVPKRGAGHRDRDRNETRKACQGDRRRFARRRGFAGPSSCRFVVVHVGKCSQSSGKDFARCCHRSGRCRKAGGEGFSRVARRAGRCSPQPFGQSEAGFHRACPAQRFDASSIPRGMTSASR